MEGAKSIGFAFEEQVGAHSHDTVGVRDLIHVSQ